MQVGSVAFLHSSVRPWSPQSPSAGTGGRQSGGEVRPLRSKHEFAGWQKPRVTEIMRLG